MPQNGMMRNMNTDQIRTHLGSVNLMHFSQAHKVPLRTLFRFKAGQVTPKQSTIDMLTKAIRKDQRKAERAAS